MKRAITESDLLQQATNNVFVVTREMVLTPGAREAASRKGITLKYAESGSPAPSAPIDDQELAGIIEKIVLDEIVRQSPPPERAGPPDSPVREQAALDPAVRGELDAMGRDAVLNLTPDDPANRAIVTVVGANRPGIIARISAVVSECGGDLADISQVILDKYFSMIVIVNLGGLESRNISFRVFKEKLQDEASRIGQVQVLVMHEDIFRAMHKV